MGGPPYYEGALISVGGPHTNHSPTLFSTTCWISPVKLRPHASTNCTGAFCCGSSAGTVGQPFDATHTPECRLLAFQSASAKMRLSE